MKKQPSDLKKLHEDLSWIVKSRNQTLHHDRNQNIKVDVELLKEKFEWIIKDSGLFEAIYLETEVSYWSSEFA